MGAARKRGTFEQRQEAAYAAIDANIEVRKKELEHLDAFEKRQKAFIGNYVNATLNDIEKRNKRNSVATALTRSDFTLIPLKYRDELGPNSFELVK